MAYTCSKGFLSSLEYKYIVRLLLITIRVLLRPLVFDDLKGFNYEFRKPSTRILSDHAIIFNIQRDQVLACD